MKTTTLLAFALLSISASGCAAETASEEPTGTTSDALSLSSYRVDLGYHGGTGGNPSRVICRPGDVAVGIYGSYGSYINELGLYCATLRANGTLGPMYTTVSSGSPGPYPFKALCPSGAVLNGLSGRSATYLDAIQVECSWLPDPIHEDYTVAWEYGGHGGSWFGDDCPDGYAITTLYIRSGSWIDATRATCTYLAP
jgi:hypothetical protein